MIHGAGALFSGLLFSGVRLGVRSACCSEGGRVVSGTGKSEELHQFFRQQLRNDVSREPVLRLTYIPPPLGQAPASENPAYSKATASYESIGKNIFTFQPSGPSRHNLRDYQGQTSGTCNEVFVRLPCRPSVDAVSGIPCPPRLPPRVQS